MPVLRVDLRTDLGPSPDPDAVTVIVVHDQFKTRLGLTSSPTWPAGAL